MANSTDQLKEKITKSLSKVNDEDKVNYLVNRLVQAEQNAANLKADSDILKLEQKKSSQLEKKVSQLEVMLTKTELSKSKLEELCRVFKNSAKEIEEQSNKKFKLMEEQHALSLEKMKSTLEDISSKVNLKEEHARNVANVEQMSAELKKLSTDYHDKLEGLKKMYDEREESLVTIDKKKDEEISILKEELKEMHKKIKDVFEENVNMRKQLIESESRMKQALESELLGKKKMTEFNEQYVNLQLKIKKQQDDFERIANQMKKMNGAMIKQEGDSKKWQAMLEKTETSLKQMSAKQKESEEALALKDRQLAQLQELCRRLKNEQKSLNQSQSNGEEKKPSDNPNPEVHTAES